MYSDKYDQNNVMDRKMLLSLIKSELNKLDRQK